MKRATLRAVDANRKPMVGQEPGIADLYAHLRERPTTYAGLVESARIGQEWDRVVTPDGETAWSRWPLVVRMSQAGVVADPEAVCHVSQRTDGLWEGFVLGMRLPEPFATAEEARDAADAEARSASWTLLNPSRPVTP